MNEIGRRYRVQAVVLSGYEREVTERVCCAKELIRERVRVQGKYLFRMLQVHRTDSAAAWVGGGNNGLT